MAQRGSKVTIVEMLNDILVTANHCKNNDQALRTLICDCSIDVVAGAKVTNITENSVIYDKDGQTNTLDFDTVVIAAGYISNNELEEALEGKVKDLSVIGDAVAPGKILDAVHGAYHTIRLMK